MILFGVHRQPYPDALAVKLHRRLTDSFSLWVDESKKQDVQKEENFTDLCYEHGCRHWSAVTTLQSDSSGPWSQHEVQAAEGEWASIGAWPQTGNQSCLFPELWKFPPGPSSQRAPQLTQRSDPRIGLLLGGPPLVVEAGGLTGAGLPPSPSDHHSVEPEPENHENMSYRKRRTKWTYPS